MATKKKGEDDELALNIDETELQTQEQPATDANAHADTPNREGLLKPTLSKKLFDNSIFTKCCRHVAAALVTIVLVALMTGILIGVAYLRFNRAKCTDVTKTYLPRFKTVNIGAKVPEKYNTALKNLISAVDLADQIFLQQVYSGNTQLQALLKNENACNGALTTYFNVNHGPWSRFDDNKLFISHIDGIPAMKPNGSNLYPADMADFEYRTWLDTLYPAERKNATSPYHVIQRTKNKDLTSVPYSEAYASQLNNVASYLKLAAEAIDDVKSKKYLTTLASDLLLNNYDASDNAFLDVDESPEIRVCLGPFGTNEDTLYRLKTSFEGIIGIIDAESTKEYSNISRFISNVDFTLPVNGTARTFRISDQRPVYIVDLLYNGGEARDTLQPFGINYPYNPAIVAARGTKRLLFGNIVDAKYDNIVFPMAKLITSRYQIHYISKDAFFYYMLAHEMARGLGPLTTSYWDGKQTVTKPVKDVLGEYYLTMNQVKADAAGLYILSYLVNSQAVTLNFTTVEKEDNPPDVIARRALYVTVVSFMLHKVRLGTVEIKSQAARVAFNYLREHKAIVLEKETILNEEEEEETIYKYGVNFAVIENVLKNFVSAILKIEATSSNSEPARAFLDKYMAVDKETLEVLANAKSVPLEIIPKFTIAETLFGKASH